MPTYLSKVLLPLFPFGNRKMLSFFPAGVVSFMNVQPFVACHLIKNGQPRALHFHAQHWRIGLSLRFPTGLQKNLPIDKSQMAEPYQSAHAFSKDVRFSLPVPPRVGRVGSLIFLDLPSCLSLRCFSLTISHHAALMPFGMCTYVAPAPGRLDLIFETFPSFPGLCGCNSKIKSGMGNVFFNIIALHRHGFQRTIP